MKRAVAFAMVGLVLHALISLVFARVVLLNHDARRMDARWLAGPVPVEVMVAGDSHARFAVEAPLLGKAINVAVPGEHFQKSRYRVPWLLDNGTRTVHTVLLPYDAASFSAFKSDDFAPEVVWNRYVDWWALGAHKGERLAFAGKWAKARLGPYVGELPTVMQLLTTTKHFRDPTDPQAGLKLTFFEGGQGAARRHLQGADVWNADMIWAFRALLDDLASRKLRVVLVRYPVTRAYAFESRRLGATPQLRDGLLAEVVKPGVVDHLDFERLFFTEPELFGDGDHLNVMGKRRFTQALLPELARLGVLGSQ